MLTDEQIAQERKAFEAVHPMPENCMWCGRGYAGTEYNAWHAHEYSALFKGWLERAAAPLLSEIDKLREEKADLARLCKEIEAKIAQRGPDVEDLKDRLVEISSAVDDSDDRGAQAIIRTTLQLLSAAPAAPEQQAPAYTAADVTDAHTKGYKLGMAQVAQAPNAQQAEAQPVGWWSNLYGFVFMHLQPHQFEVGSTLYLRDGTPAWRVESKCSKTALISMEKLPHGTVFYAAPPKAVPLTEAQAKAIAGEIFPMAQLDAAAVYHARLCEVYGIGTPGAGKTGDST